MTNLASSVTWGASYGSPTITVSYDYEYKRVGADMQYRVQITINPVSGIRYFGYPIYAQVSLDGNLKNSATLKSASPSQWTSAITYTTPWLSVTGKTTGSTALLIKLYSGLGSSRTETYNYNLIVSPAASTLSAQPGDIGSAIPITIDRENTSFTHTLKYDFYNASGTIKEKTTATSVSWTPPMSLCSEIPSNLSGTCTITCETYSGNTLVGSTDCTVNLTVPKSVQLEVTDGWASVSVYNTGTAAANIPAFVQGYSKAEVTFNANKISTKNSYGATPKSYKIVYGSATVTSSPYRTPVLTNAGTMTVYCYVTDTRDRTVGSAINFPVLPYSVPTISGIELFRCDSSGAENSAGNYIYVKATPKYSSLNENNSITFRVRYGVNKNYGDYSVLASGVASILGDGAVLSTSSYIVEISVVDALGKASIYTGYIPTDDVALHLGKGGKRAAFFKYAEKDDTLEVGGDLEIEGGLSISGNPVADYIVETGTSGIWTYRKWASGMAECWGRKTYTDVAIDISWGSGYYASLGSPDNYPFAFVNDYPCVNLTLQASKGNGWGIYNNSNYSLSNPGGIYVYNPTSQSAVNITVNISAKGKWK